MELLSQNNQPKTKKKYLGMTNHKKSLLLAKPKQKYTQPEHEDTCDDEGSTSDDSGQGHSEHYQDEINNGNQNQKSKISNNHNNLKKNQKSAFQQDKRKSIMSESDLDSEKYQQYDLWKNNKKNIQYQSRIQEIIDSSNLELKNFDQNEKSIGNIDISNLNQWVRDVVQKDIEKDYLYLEQQFQIQQKWLQNFASVNGRSKQNIDKEYQKMYDGDLTFNLLYMPNESQKSAEICSDLNFSQTQGNPHKTSLNEIKACFQLADQKKSYYQQQLLLQQQQKQQEEEQLQQYENLSQISSKKNKKFSAPPQYYVKMDYEKDSERASQSTSLYTAMHKYSAKSFTQKNCNSSNQIQRQQKKMNLNTQNFSFQQQTNLMQELKVF